MRVRVWLAAIALFGFGCTHTKTTDAGSNVPSKESKREQPGAKAQEGAAKTPGAGDHERPRRPAEIPVASAPSGLLKPGAEEKIHDKLAADGATGAPTGGERAGSMGAALKRFQAAHDLPATGAPDLATVRKLGLDPDDIFIKADPTQGRE